MESPEHKVEVGTQQGLEWLLGFGVILLKMGLWGCLLPILKPECFLDCNPFSSISFMAEETSPTVGRGLCHHLYLLESGRRKA